MLKTIQINLYLLLFAFSLICYSQSDITRVGNNSGYGRYNTNVGYYAGNKFPSSGYYYSVMVGSNAGRNSTSGHSVFIGNNSGYKSTGSANTFIGSYTGYSNTSGSSNIFAGKDAGRNNTTGYHNTFLGVVAGKQNTTGYRNTFIGYEAGTRNQTGDYNTYLGYYSAWNNSSGNNNVFMGSLSGYSNTTGSNNIFIGYQAGYNETGSNKLYIDNSSTSAPLIWGDFGSDLLRVNGSLQSTGSFNPSGGFVSGAFLDDDGTLGGNNDDWLRFNGYVEMRSNTDNYGIVLRNKDASDYLGLTQKDGWSYFTDSNTSPNYFLRGNGGNVEVRENLKANSITSRFHYTTGGDMLLSGSSWGMTFYIDTDNNSSDSYKWFGHGSEKMRLTDDGRLGVGNTSPAYKLHVMGDIYADGGWLRVNGNRGMYNQSYATHIYAHDANYWRTRSDRGLIVANKANAIKGYLYHDNNNSFGLLDGDGNWAIRLERDVDSRFYVNNNEKMRIKADGNVGIGTTDPGNYRLNVNGGLYVAKSVRFDCNDCGSTTTEFGTSNWGDLTIQGRVLSTNNNLHLSPPGGTKVIINDVYRAAGGSTSGHAGLSVSGETNLAVEGGGVGIGISGTPAEKLHVNGAIRGNVGSGALKISTADGYVDIGPQNEFWSHFETNRPRFYFNRGITIDGGMVGSHINQDLQLQTNGTTAVTISNVDQDVTVNSNLSVNGRLQLNRNEIFPNNLLDSLLVIDNNGLIASRSVRSIESPWLFEKILVGQDSLLVICPDSAVIGQVLVDVIDLNGNLKIGDDAYIDDDLEVGDNGIARDIPDDWMKFSSRIEFKSSHDDYGIVLFDKFNHADFLNLHHAAGTSYLSNGSNASNFFMRSTGRDVEFGGNVNVPSLQTSEYSSSESVTISADSDNNGTGETISLGTNGTAGSPTFNELMRLEENGDIFINTVEDDPTKTQLLVRDQTSGKLFAREANTVGPWDIRTSGDIHYGGGNIGLGISAGEATQSLDIGTGTIRVRNLSPTTTEDELVVVDAAGNFQKRNTSSLNLSPWTVNETQGRLSYGGDITIGSHEPPTEKLDVRGNIVTSGTIRLGGLADQPTQTSLLVADVDGNVSSREVNSLVGGASESDKLVVVDATNNLQHRHLSTILDDIKQSPFDDFGTYISYGGSVILDDESVIHTPTAKLDVDGNIRVRSIDRDFANELTDIVMVDADGFMKRRGVDALELSPWVRNGNDLHYVDGKIGIGASNTSSTQQLYVSSNLRTALNVETNYQSDGYGILATVDHDNLRAIAVRDVSVDGTTSSADVFRVWGNGKVEAKEVLVAPDVWYDEVFKKDYDLKTLDEVEEFVQENNHLPDVPSEGEVLEKGVNLGEMEGILLKKVEELTLYIIEQNKQLQKQNERIQVLEEKLKTEEK